MLSTHLVIDPSNTDERKVIRAATDVVTRGFGIAHSTIQVEVDRADAHGPANTHEHHDHEH